MSETDEQHSSIAGTTPEREDGRREDEWRVPTQQYEPPPPAPPFSWPPPPPAGASPESEHHEFHHPLDRVTGRLP
ncbi:MAG: hypothetical protein HW413_3015, partial [Thermoleophilia bacterium]|nr:hypothetical protein [Thermoleophilia bacterium]